MTTPETAPFATLVQNALNDAVTPEKIAAKVQQHVDRAVEEAISDAMRSWSGTGKAVKAAIENSLRVDSLNLPAYGHVVSEILRRQVEARVADVVAAKLTKDMDDLLGLAPKRMRLSALVAELVGPEGTEEPMAGSVSCVVEWRDYDFAEIKITGREIDDWRDVDVVLHIHLSKKRAEFGDANPDGSISFGHVSGSDLKKDHRFGWSADRKRFNLGRGHAFEQKVLALYACGTVIEIDEDDVVTERDY